MKKPFKLIIRGQKLLNLVVLCGLAFSLVTQSSKAVILLGSGDPAYNTAPPTGVLMGSGWQYQGQWGGFLGTVIAPQYFIAAQHVGGAIGQAFVFNGVTYTTTAYWDDSTTDLRIWKVGGVFSSYAPLYSLSDEVGKTLVVIGRGTQRGDPVTLTVVQTVYTTNVVNLKTLGISAKKAAQEFPGATFQGNTMTVVTSEVATNMVLKGWQAGPSDGVMRWGQNQVLAAGNLIAASFDKNGGTNEACLSGGDSSGGLFIQDGGVWKLAGINYGIEGPFGISATDPGFYGAIFDESGLYVGGTLVPDDGQLRPASFYATRISPRVAWIQSVINQ
jgi:hypothetical protein